MSAFTNGLRNGKFLFSLCKNDPKTISNVLYRATKYMNAENALLTWEKKLKKRERQEEAWQDKQRKITRSGDRKEDRHSKPPTRRFTSFTSLTAPINQFLMQIKDKGALTFPDKLKGDPNKRPRDKYCCFHCNYGYDTSDCYDLKQQIEALIRQRKLQRFVGKEKKDPPQEQVARRENGHPRPPIRDIRRGITASGSSKKARKTYFRMVQNI